MSENAASNSGEVKNPVNSTVVTDSEYLAARISQLTAPKEEVKAESEKEPEEVEKVEGDQPTEAKAQTEEAKVEEKKEADVLSKIDLDSMSEAEIRALADKSRSKALSRFADLTAEKRALQQQLAQLQAAQAPKQTLEVAPTIPKEYATIETVEGLREKLTEATSTYEWAESQLDQVDHLGPNESIETSYGVFTKAKLKELMRTARKAKDQWIPAQLSSLQSKAQRAAQRAAFENLAKQELPWMSGEDNDTRKQYEMLVQSPTIKKLKEMVPEVEPDLGYILGHAVNSIAGRKLHSLTGEDKKNVTLTPPAAVKQKASGAADEVHSKAVNDLSKKYHSTSSEQDFLALRTAQLAKRRK